MFEILLAIAAVLCCYLLWNKQFVNQGYPPGPFTLPVLGNILQMGLAGDLLSFLRNCRRTYGNVYTIEVGGTKRVVISGYEYIHHLFVSNADYSSGRSLGSLPADMQEAAVTAPGLLWSEFPHWKTLRTFSMKVMREEGMGKSKMELKIIDEIQMFCSRYIERNLSCPIDIGLPLNKATSNIISTMLFGGRSDYDDPKLDQMVNIIDSAVKASMRSGIFKNIPFMKYFKFSGMSETREASDVLMVDMTEKVREHKTTLDQNNLRDIFDAFLSYQARFSAKDDQKCFSDDNAATMALQMYFAGMETTATALKWTLLFTCYNPEVMKKVQDEIAEHIGKDRVPSYADRLSMPYTESVLLESLRLANITPTALPRMLSTTLQVDGTVVPAGADLLTDVSSILHDRWVFEDPEKFKPERYLSGDIKLKKQRTLPFGLGRRVCIGESLARMELFLFYTTILQRYNVRFADSNKQPSLKPITGLISSPQRYELVFTQRQL